MSHGALNDISHKGNEDPPNSDDTVMKTSYNQSISMFATMSALREKDPANIPMSAVMTVSNPMHPLTGITFIPPLNANPTIVSPGLEPHLTAVFALVASIIPSYFNWFDLDNVAEVKKWGKRDVSKYGPYLQEVPNQMGCGCCWAVSSASALSDRTAIRGQTRNTPLSPTLTMSCIGSVSGDVVESRASNGCNGGFPADAASLFGEYGTVSAECSSYDWCSTSSSCKSGGTDLNALMPHCRQQQNQCITCTSSDSGWANGRTSCTTLEKVSHKLHKVKKKSDGTYSTSLTNINDIKTDVFQNGPVVVAMAVYQDFYASGGWAQTNGVYINMQSRNAPYSAADMNTTLAGYHAVVIVGWGVEKDVKNWAGGGKGDISYWIVRNSWADTWNAGNTVTDSHGKKLRMPGYWKHAMTQNFKGMELNEAIGMDKPIRVGSQFIGGGTSFIPDIEEVAPPPVTKHPHTSSPNTSSPHTSSPHTSFPHTSFPHTSSPHTSSPHTSFQYTSCKHHELGLCR